MQATFRPNRLYCRWLRDPSNGVLDAIPAEAGGRSEAFVLPCIFMGLSIPAATIATCLATVCEAVIVDSLRRSQPWAPSNTATNFPKNEQNSGFSISFITQGRSLLPGHPISSVFPPIDRVNPRPAMHPNYQLDFDGHLCEE
jgi:hypothetical protein